MRGGETKASLLIFFFSQNVLIKATFDQRWTLLSLFIFLFLNLHTEISVTLCRFHFQTRFLFIFISHYYINNFFLKKGEKQRPPWGETALQTLRLLLLLTLHIGSFVSH